jgi:hypothetical protein
MVKFIDKEPIIASCQQFPEKKDPQEGAQKTRS